MLSTAIWTQPFALPLIAAYSFGQVGRNSWDLYRVKNRNITPTDIKTLINGCPPAVTPTPELGDNTEPNQNISTSTHANTTETMSPLLDTRNETQLIPTGDEDIRKQVLASLDDVKITPRKVLLTRFKSIIVLFILL